MRDFFKPWRRKLGVVTLAMACVLMVGWVRSLNAFDVITLPLWGLNAAFFQSANGDLACEWIIVDDQPIIEWKACSLRDLRMAGANAERSGLDISVAHDNIVSLLNFEGLPYWSIVLPLTLLSAYLLLTKSRAMTSKSTEPAPTTGT